jgi:hypothetical protein
MGETKVSEVYRIGVAPPSLRLRERAKVMPALRLVTKDQFTVLRAL